MKEINMTPLVDVMPVFSSSSSSPRL